MMMLSSNKHIIYLCSPYVTNIPEVFRQVSCARERPTEILFTDTLATRVRLAENFRY